MKATCIVGSARANGSTARLIDAMIEGMQQAGIETIRHCIGDKNLRFCLGCKRCYTDGRCVQKDDVEPIVRDLISSDFVVIAAPSYWADVPGQLKTFFDRCTPFGDTNPNRVIAAEKPIKGVAIAVRAGVRPQENELILNSISHFYGHLGIKTIRRISICQVDMPDDLLRFHGQTLRELTALGRSLPAL